MSAAKRLTNEDLATLIDRNHDETKRRFKQIETRLDEVEANVDAIDSEMVSRSELDDLLASRESLIVKAIDDRMIYYGRRGLALVGTPVGIWILNRIWEAL